MEWNVQLVSGSERLYAVYGGGILRGFVAGDSAKVRAFVESLKAKYEGRVMERTKIDNGGGYSIIHEEFAGRESEKRCFRRHEITLSAWQNMTGKDEIRFWRARGVSREYTALGYMVVGYSRRRWGDGLKVLDRWHIVKVGTEYEPIERKLDDVANA